MGCQSRGPYWPTRKGEVSRLKPVIVATGVDSQAIAAADLGKAPVEAVIAHQGTPRNRTSLEFQVKWRHNLGGLGEGEKDCIKSYPRAGLKALLK